MLKFGNGIVYHVTGFYSSQNIFQEDRAQSYNYIPSLEAGEVAGNKCHSVCMSIYLNVHTCR